MIHNRCHISPGLIHTFWTIKLNDPGRHRQPFVVVRNSSFWPGSLDMLLWPSGLGPWTCCSDRVAWVPGHVALTEWPGPLDMLLWPSGLGPWTCCSDRVAWVPGHVALTEWPTGRSVVCSPSWWSLFGDFVVILCSESRPSGNQVYISSIMQGQSTWQGTGQEVIDLIPGGQEPSSQTGRRITRCSVYWIPTPTLVEEGILPLLENVI